MNARSFLSLASFLLLAACAGSTDETPAGGSPSNPSTSSSTESVSVPSVGDVRAVRVSDQRTQDASHVAAFRDRTKIEKAVELLGLKGTLTETTQLPNCIPDVKVEMFDAAGKVLATAEVYCGSKNAILRAGGKAYAAPSSDVEGLVKLEADRTLVANWLYDVSLVEIDQPLKEQHRAFETKAEIDQAIGALSAVDTIDTSAPKTRCAADYTVTFTRAVGEGTPVKSRLFISCGGDPKASQPAWFQANEALEGQVTVNAQIIAQLASAATVRPQ